MSLYDKRSSWNAGLTKENNLSVAKQADKIRGRKMPKTSGDKHWTKRLGRVVWNKGVKIGPNSAEHNVSIGRKGVKCPQRGRKGCKPWNTGKRCPQLGDSRRGRPSWNLGISPKKSTIDKLRATLAIPEVRERRTSRMLSAVCSRPNKFEAACMAHLDRIFPGKFRYTGNGSKMVNSRSADAYSEELNTVCLFHGVYWHLKKSGLDITEENKRAVEKVDSLPFLSAGYKVLFIWEDEFPKMACYPEEAR